MMFIGPPTGNFSDIPKKVALDVDVPLSCILIFNYSLNDLMF
jgi:hypothetical protein